MRIATVCLILSFFSPAHGAQRQVLSVLRGHSGAVNDFRFSRDGRGVSVGDDATARLWGAGPEPGSFSWSPGKGDALAADISPDGRLVLTGSEDRILRLWDADSAELLAQWPGHKDEPRQIVVSPAGDKAASVSWDGEIRLWDLAARKALAVIPGREDDGALCAAFSPDGKKLIVGGWDQTVRLYDAQSASEIGVWTGHTRPVLSVAFSPDGKYALSASRDTTLRLWNVAKATTAAVWKGHAADVYETAFSGDGLRAYSAGIDNTVRMWRVSDGRTLGVRRSRRSGERILDFHPNLDAAMSTGSDNILQLIAIPNKPPPAPDASNRDSKISLGRTLFYDKRLSGDATLDCASCHIPEKAFTDGRTLSIGYTETSYFRNTPSLLDMEDKESLYWDGRFAQEDLPSLIRDHIAEAHFMNADGRLVVERIRQAPRYVRDFRRLYGGEPSYGRLLDALTLYVRSLRSPAAKSPPGPEALRGEKLFNEKAGCAQCHSGPQLSDGKFYARGVAANSEIFKDALRRISFRRFFKIQGAADYDRLRRDPGLAALTQRKEDVGKFRTPALLSAAYSPPYMHNGTIATLDEAVAFEGPDLSEEERRDVIAYLRSLSGEYVPQAPPELPPYELIPSFEKPSDTAPSEPETLSQPPPLATLPAVVSPPDNPTTPEKAALGRLLFFDPRLSGNRDTSCADCHEPSKGWGDGASVARGYAGTMHWRNAQTILNAAHFSKLNWDGSKTSLEEQARSAVVSNISQNGDPAMIEERLAEVPVYLSLFKRAFGLKRPTFEAVLKALAAFQRETPVSQDSPLDRFLRSDVNALTPAAKRGKKIFEGKAGCLRCHNGPLASDQAFHATGVPPSPILKKDALRQVTVRFQHASLGVPEEIYRSADSDPGLYLTTLQKDDVGKFRTASLRELAHTAPYMHNGIFKTLEDVVEFYDRGGGETLNKSPLLRPLQLSSKEKNDLVAFLNSMSGPPIDVPYPELPSERRP